MIQFIVSKCQNDAKFVLWRMADYQYQIEIIYKSIVTQIAFDGEYYKALTKFGEIVNDFDSELSENV